MLRTPETNPAELRIAGEGSCDALELLALLEGCRGLLAYDRPGHGPAATEPTQPLLQTALSASPQSVAAHLALLAHGAPADTPPLLLRLLETALELS